MVLWVVLLVLLLCVLQTLSTRREGFAIEIPSIVDQIGRNIIRTSLFGHYILETETWT